MGPLKACQVLPPRLIKGQALDILKRLYVEHKDDDDDDDDDVSFAKWTSSFWGHGWIEEDE